MEKSAPAGAHTGGAPRPAGQQKGRAMSGTRIGPPVMARPIFRGRITSPSVAP